MAVVIGGGRNLGKAIARAYLAEEASVCIVGRSAPTLEAAVAELSAEGAPASFAQADVTSIPDLERLFAEVDARFGGVDILVNSAGNFLNPTLAEATEADWDETMGINLKSVFFAIQKVVPIMERRGDGSIITMSSVMGVKGRAGSAIYCASKAGVINMTRALAVELGGQAIRVNSIAPGFTLDPDAEVEIPQPVIEELTSTITLGRAGTAPEIASAAVYLASDESSFTTGVTLFVDGGETAR